MKPLSVRPKSLASILLCATTCSLLLAQPVAPRKFTPRKFDDKPVHYIPPAGVKLLVDVQYRPGDPVWRVDVALPAKPASEPRAAIINIHGGGWSTGDKGGGRSLICHWAQQGYVAVSVRYRLLGEAPFPACIEDVKCVVRWLRAHAAEYGVDPNRIAAFGHSAGAHLATVLGVCPREAGFDTGPWTEQSSLVNAVAAIATPTDLINSRELARFPGVSEEAKLDLAKRCSPITHASASAPPFLLIHGTKDTTVPVDQGHKFAEALRAAGAQNVDLFLLDNLGHDPLPTHELLLRPLLDAFLDATVGEARGKLTQQRDLARRWLQERGTPAGFGFAQITQYDRNGDGKVAQEEWPGSEEMLSRFDRGEDNAIQPQEMERWGPRNGRGSAESPGTPPLN